MISIIIPVYNVEKYLAKCLDSVLHQTYHDIEVILVDDGSIDESGIICDEYAKRDNRISVYHRENCGVSATRNFGLKKAKGEWILFVDSDDWISNRPRPWTCGTSGPPPRSRRTPARRLPRRPTARPCAPPRPCVRSG